MHSRTRLVVLLATLVLGVALVPLVASAFLLNLANASLAHAMALPQDAPDRRASLSSADELISKANRASRLPRADFASGRVAFARGDAEKATSVLSKLASPDAMIEFVSGNAYWQANQTDLALAHWARGGALGYFLQEAQRSSQAHDWGTAKNSAAIAAGIDPLNAQAHYIWADAASREPTLSPRIFDELDRALALTDDKEFRATILSRQAELRVRQSRFDQALSLYEEAMAEAPTDARPRTGYALALVHSNSGARDMAVSRLQQVTVDSPWYVDAYIALATLAEAKGDMSDAEAWLQKGLEHNKDNAQVLTHLGEFYARHGRIEDAHSAFLLALRYETRADGLLLISRRLAEVSAP